MMLKLYLSQTVRLLANFSHAIDAYNTTYPFNRLVGSHTESIHRKNDLKPPSILNGFITIPHPRTRTHRMQPTPTRQYHA